MQEPLTDAQPVVVFRLGAVLCALPVTAVLQIVHYPQLLEPPARPELLAGFVQLGESLVPVLHLSRWLDLGELEPQVYTPLLLLRDGDCRLAFGADGVLSVTDLGAATLSPAEDTHTLNGCVEGVFEAAGATVHLLNPQRLFLRQERDCVKQLARQAEARLGALETPV